MTRGTQLKLLGIDTAATLGEKKWLLCSDMKNSLFFVGIILLILARWMYLEKKEYDFNQAFEKTGRSRIVLQRDGGLYIYDFKEWVNLTVPTK